MCGNHGTRNFMIPQMKHISTPNGERQLTQKLNCNDYGIYAACCKNSDNYYVGQIMTSFLQHAINMKRCETNSVILKITTIRLY